jgi:hypothetical protein
MTTPRSDPWMAVTFGAVTVLFCGTVLMRAEARWDDVQLERAKWEAAHARMLVERRNTIEILTSIKKQVENNRDRLAQTRALLVRLAGEP